MDPSQKRYYFTHPEQELINDSKSERKFVSIDIETTGLDPKEHQILEVGFVVAKFENLDEVLSSLRVLIQYKEYHGSGIALAMNAKLIEEISSKKAFNIISSFKSHPALLDYEIVLDGSQPSQMKQDFNLMVNYFLSQTISRNYKNDRISVAGKNYNAFDKLFLDRDFDFTNEHGIKHRVFDPGILYFDPLKDSEIPNTDECLKRAGIDKSSVHSAIDDAKIVIELLHNKWKTKGKL